MEGEKNKDMDMDPPVPRLDSWPLDRRLIRRSPLKPQPDREDFEFHHCHMPVETCDATNKFTNSFLFLSLASTYIVVHNGCRQPMAVEPFLGTRAQRAFVVTSEPGPHRAHLLPHSTVTQLPLVGIP